MSPRPAVEKRPDPAHPAASAPAAAGALHPGRSGALAALGLLAVVGLGAFVRAHGFTDLDLWFDDAWAAAPARVGWGSALHMVLTAPGYALALRLWVRLDPGTTWFTQIPAYALSLCAIPAVYGLLRYLRANRGVALIFALFAAADPVLVQYATRLKEYNFDLLAACAVLALAERARRRPSGSTFGALAVVSLVTLFFSAGSLAIVAGAWLCLGVLALRDRALLRGFVVATSGLAAGCVVIWLAFFRQLPSVLNFNWRRRGYLIDYRSFGLFERTLTMVFGGFLHGVAAYPVPPTFFHDQPGLHTPWAAVLGVVLLGIAIVPALTASWRGRGPVPALPAALGLLVAIVLAFADRVPFGDGRTDEALYPALYVCLAAVVMALAPHASRLADTALKVGVALCACLSLVGGTVAFGAAHQAVYPTIALRELWARLEPQVRPDQVVFVDTFNAFAWCYYEITPCRFQVGGTPPWPQGFRPRSMRSDVFIASHYGNPEPELDAAQRHLNELWYVGYTWGTYDTGAGPALANVPVGSYMLADLRRDGWRPAPYGPGHQVLGVTHCYAELFVRDARDASRADPPDT